MTDDQFPTDPFDPADQPPVPPLADGGADPTLPGGADPTLAQPVQPHYTTGPGAPPERAGDPAYGVAAGAGSVGANPGVGDRPAWLLPAVAGAGAALVVALIAFFVFRGGDDDGSIASTDSTTSIAPETTIEGGSETTVAPETTVDGGAETTVAPETTIDGGVETTVPTDSAPATTVVGGSTGGDADGSSGSDDPCAAGYTEVSSLPFGLCSQGGVVAQAQFAIATAGTPIDADGFYGPASFAAVQELQRSLGLDPDGIVSQELLDLLAGSVPDAEFSVASPGTVNIGGSEFPITRTCRTIPFEGFTADYQVISYAFADSFGTNVIHRYFDEGGATGVYFGDTGPVTELPSGFGFELIEGDGAVLVSVNPVDAPSDSCVGRVTQFDGDGQQQRVFNVVAACRVGGTDRLQLSEDAAIDVTDQGEGRGTFEFSLINSDEFFLGDDDDASLLSDGTTVTVDATTTGGETRRFVATYPASLSSC